jgi:hypothetical protein
LLNIYITRGAASADYALFRPPAYLPENFRVNRNSLMKRKYAKTPFNQFLLKCTRFFDRSLFLSSSVGLPFCIFKAIFGLLLCRQAGFKAGIIILLWAGIDIIMNLLRILYSILNKDAPFEFCLISQIGRYFDRPSLFLAIDTFLSFSIICWFMWSGWITMLKPNETFFWYLATTINLLSLSIVKIMKEIIENSD